MSPMPSDLAPLWISLKTAAAATGIAVVTGITAARFMLGHRDRGRSLIDGILTLPLVLPPTVVGFLLLLLLGKNSPVGQGLSQVGLSLIFTWPATVLAASVVAFPLMYKTVLGAFEQVDPTLISCARTLGASEWHIFWLVLLPLAGPGLLAGTVLAFARALGEFGATLMVGGSIPGVTQTVPIAIFFAAEAGRMGVALAWVLLMVAVSLAVIGVIQLGAASPGRSRPSPLVRRAFDWLLRVAATGRSTGWPTGQPMDQPQGAELVVAIQKQVPGFCLRLNFRTDREPLGLLGASGSGKSMTLRCIAGLETPDSGRIVLNGRVLFDADRGINVPSRDRRVGLVFQNYALFPHLTVAQNLAFARLGQPGASNGTIADHLAQMQLAHLSDRYPHELSGGQQQRVALARALAIAPEILLLDEPLSALDAYLRSHVERRLMAVLSDYGGITLFITHKMEEAYRLCRNLLVLCEGEVAAAGPKEDIFQRPPTYPVAQVTECKNFSRAQGRDRQTVTAIDWDCVLRVAAPLPPELAYVGIRAHHVQFGAATDGENTFPGWLAMLSETQHRVTLYLKLHSPPNSAHDYHLQAEVYREKWAQLADRPFPWPIYLAPERLMPLRTTPAASAIVQANLDQQRTERTFLG